jgi:folate-binding protein YgfZ
VSNDVSDSSPGLFETRQAANTSVVFFDLSDRTQIEISGGDRVRFLHSFTSNDIKRLKPGQGCETFLTNIKGKVVAHFFVFCHENSLWLDGTPGQQDAIVSHLRKFVLIDDVQFHPRGDERADLYVTGPLAAELLQWEGGLAVGGHVRRENENRIIDFHRVDLFGAPGFLVSTPVDQKDEVKRGFASVGVPEGSRELFEAMRIEAGYPQFGLDFTEDHLAQEVARTKQCISFNKGCYLGQETIARLDAVGHTNRELRRLRFKTSVVPNAGTPVFDAAGETELGTVTSATLDVGSSQERPVDSVIAMGMLKRAACIPETVVSLKLGEHQVLGHVLK